MDYNKLALELHEKYKGKITTSLRDKEELNRDKLSAYYSPGVGAVSQAIAENPADLPKYTWTNNLVAVISDGSAILDQKPPCQLWKEKPCYLSILPMSTPSQLC